MPHVNEDISQLPKYVLERTTAQELRIVCLITPITNMNLLILLVPILFEVSHNRCSNLGSVRYILVFKPFLQAEKKVVELVTLDNIDRLDNWDETLKERLGSVLLDHLLQSIAQAPQEMHWRRRGHSVARRPAVDTHLFLEVEDISSSPFPYALLCIQQDKGGIDDSAG